MGIGHWALEEARGQGAGGRGERQRGRGRGRNGDRETRRPGDKGKFAAPCYPAPLLPCPEGSLVPNAQFYPEPVVGVARPPGLRGPMPDAPCPMPHAPIPNSLTS
ncbi:MAG: hypothetical protein F6J93_33975 [Oscillatoria sp. SIO1A7]|nr:hypothetical protein [Oscillatoria sp. SIO1A7]